MKRTKDSFFGLYAATMLLATADTCAAATSPIEKPKSDIRETPQHQATPQEAARTGYSCGNPNDSLKRAYVAVSNIYSNAQLNAPGKDVMMLVIDPTGTIVGADKFFIPQISSDIYGHGASSGAIDPKRLGNETAHIKRAKEVAIEKCGFTIK